VVRHTNGVLPMAALARERGFDTLAGVLATLARFLLSSNLVPVVARPNDRDMPYPTVNRT
jgi:hypothetical protein